MELHFRNQTSSLVSVAIMLYSPDSCGQDGNWATEGWWNISPGGEAYVADTNDEYAAYYAESDAGLVWSGPYGPVYVQQQAFQSCVDIGDNNPETRIVGMHLIDMEDSDIHYVNLTEG
jgi:hypothetical protein